MIHLNKNSIIYVACPANVVTGGPELLHQLVYKLTSKSFNAQIFYISFDDKKIIIQENYLQYIHSFTTKIDDNPDNILIVPETMTALLFKYRSIQKVIWWLSIDHYLDGINGLKKKIEIFFRKDRTFYIHSKRMQKKINLHLVQSKYAEEYLKSNDITNIKYLSDYLRKDFILQSVNVDISKKKDIVLYNPKKGIAYTKKLIDAMPEFNWTPIINLTPTEVVNLISMAKVYVDFGYHPGKDRLPRECALLKCCVITNKIGAAFYQEDIPINEEFKFDEETCSISDIRETIKRCLDHYEFEIEKFDNYRTEIINQEYKFKKEIEEVFIF